MLSLAVLTGIALFRPRRGLYSSMKDELTQEDILAWSEERHRQRFDATGALRPVGLATPEEDRKECACCIIEIDAWIAEYRQWLDELVPGSAFAAEKHPVYWDAITRLEQRKQHYSNRIVQIDSMIAKGTVVP